MDFNNYNNNYLLITRDYVKELKRLLSKTPNIDISWGRTSMRLYYTFISCTKEEIKKTFKSNLTKKKVY